MGCVSLLSFKIAKLFCMFSGLILAFQMDTPDHLRAVIILSQIAARFGFSLYGSACMVQPVFSASATLTNICQCVVCR